MWHRADGVHFLTLVCLISRAHPQVNVRVSRRILCFRGGNSRSLNTFSLYSSSYNMLQEQEPRHENYKHRKIIRTQIIHTEKSYAHKSTQKKSSTKKDHTHTNHTHTKSYAQKNHRPKIIHWKWCHR